MTSTIKVNTIQNTCGADIIKESSNTITIGASGDTVTLASGASQSGFGRSGSVDWQTGSIKTSTFTPTSGEGYFVDTSSGAVTANLPAGSAGAIVAFADYTRTFATNSFTIVANGSEKIGGVANGSVTLSINGQALTLVYVDATEGWINVQNAEDTEAATPPFIQATGGTETTSGNFKIHTFTGPGTFQVTQLAPSPSGNPNSMDYLVVAGGGGGGSCCGAGGGGAGGFRESPGTATCYTSSPLGAAPAAAITATVTSFPITVGAGGAGGGIACQTGSRPEPGDGSNGSNSIFSTITSTGGGFGAGVVNNGGPGGSGGGSAHANPAPVSAGTGNNPPTNPAQGTNGVCRAPDADDMGGAGGGATTAGQSGPSTRAGGTGATTNITGGPVAYAGGGGGGIRNIPSPNADKNNYYPNASSCGTGGKGGLGFCGGTPQPPGPATGVAGTTNRGGGGGGSARTGGPKYHLGGNGGSGVVIIRYKYQ